MVATEAYESPAAQQFHSERRLCRTTCAHQRTCARTFVTALLAVAKPRNSPNAHQQWNGQINTLWRIPTVDFPTAMRMNNLQPHTTTEVDFTNQVLSKRSQTKRVNAM